MRFWILLTALLTASITAQVTLTGTNTESTTLDDYPTSTAVTYNTDTALRTLSSARSTGTLSATSSTDTTNATSTGNSTTTRSSQTLLVGGTRISTALNGTVTGNSTRTATSAQPTNTQPCNGYPELCPRKYSNITHIGAHNSPFVRPGNIASNQALEVESQLNDGIRMLQFQTHQPNGTNTPIYLCHSTCDLLNAGTLTDYLTTVAQWLDANPYEVVTILMGNDDVIGPGNYTGAVADSGLSEFLYTPPTAPMPLDAWPTLSEMIIMNQRAVVMLDYEANQDEIPWLIDQYGVMWETPFSPTDLDIPCVVDRPPDQDEEISRDRMYMANHNLNVDISFAGFSILVPSFTTLNVTNSDVVGLAGSAANARVNCTAAWDRPPTFLLVDFYNIGNYNGSIFQVAADANNVTYDRSSCCDTDNSPSSNAAASLKYSPFMSVMAGLLMLLVFATST